MMTIRFRADETEMRVDSDEAAYEDISITVDGPRAPFTLLNEANGMMMHVTDPLQDGDAIYILVRARISGVITGKTEVPLPAAIHVPPHQQGWGWMRLNAGRNVLKIVPLAGA